MDGRAGAGGLGRDALGRDHRADLGGEAGGAAAARGECRGGSGARGAEPVGEGGEQDRRALVARSRGTEAVPEAPVGGSGRVDRGMEREAVREAELLRRVGGRAGIGEEPRGPGRERGIERGVGKAVAEVAREGVEPGLGLGGQPVADGEMRLQRATGKERHQSPVDLLAAHREARDRRRPDRHGRRELPRGVEVEINRGLAVEQHGAALGEERDPAILARHLADGDDRRERVDHLLARVDQRRGVAAIRLVDDDRAVEPGDLGQAGAQRGDVAGDAAIRLGPGRRDRAGGAAHGRDELGGRGRHRRQAEGIVRPGGRRHQVGLERADLVGQGRAIGPQPERCLDPGSEGGADLVPAEPGGGEAAVGQQRGRDQPFDRGDANPAAVTG